MVDPIIVDVTRDFVDWFVIGTSIVSAAVGVIAIIVALRANQHAKESESRSRQLIADERRRTFDLEILRDLLELLSDGEALNAWLNSAWLAHQALSARLSMLPTEDLPLWRLTAQMGRSHRDLAAQIGATADDYHRSDIPEYGSNDEELRSKAGHPIVMVWHMDSLVAKLRDALREDIECAVRRRMEAV